MKKVLEYIKFPFLLFVTGLLFGLVIGILTDSIFLADEVKGISTIISSSQKKFFEVFSKNAIIIVTIYLTAAFTKYYAYFNYVLNGLVLGCICIWAIKVNALLLLLVVPHGILEIPCILGTGYIVVKGKQFVNEKFYKYVWTLMVHLIFIFVSAFIECFITPQIYGIFVR